MDRTLPGSRRGFALPVFLAGCLAAAVVLLAAGPVPSARSATVPAGFAGMNDWAIPSDGVMADVAGIGVHRWRAGLFWYRVEREQGHYDWSEYDALAARAARSRVSLLLVIASCPDWACPDLAGPPATPSALAAHHEFVRQAVARYGRSGSFWAQHPELPYQPVTDWQVWNEVNSAAYWKPRPDAAGYARFLAGDAAVIRAADPGATVVASGLTNEGDVPLGDFLHQLYAQPGFRSSFDVLALHPYAGNGPAAIRLLDVARREEVAAGDGGRRMWVTEFGWGTATANMPNLPSPQQQADLLGQTYDAMIGCRGRWNLDRAYWFGYQDIDPPAGEADFAGYHTGLHDTSGRAKPGWQALRSYADGAGSAGSCPLAGPQPQDAPQTSIVASRRVTRARRTRLKLVASKRGSRFQCSLRRMRKRAGSKSARPRWRRCRKRYRTPRLHRGRYKLLVRAVDRRGNIDRSPAAARLALRGSRTLTLRVRVVRPRRR